MTGRPQITHLHTPPLAPPVTPVRLHWYLLGSLRNEQPGLVYRCPTYSVNRLSRLSRLWKVVPGAHSHSLTAGRLGRSLRRTASRLALHRRDKISQLLPPSLSCPCGKSPNQHPVSQIPQSMRKVRLALLRRTLSGTSTLGGFRSPPQSTQTVLGEVQTCRPLPNGRSARSERLVWLVWHWAGR